MRQEIKVDVVKRKEEDRGLEPLIMNLSVDS